MIARLGVDTDFSGQGLGSRLLIEAWQSTLTATEEVAIKVMLVDAIDEETKSFYLRFGFIDLPGKRLKLFLPIEIIRQLLTY